MNARATLDPGEDPAQPVIAPGAAKRDTGLWIFMGLLLAGGAGVVAAMGASRADTATPATQITPGQEGGAITSPPPLGLAERAYPRGYSAQQQPTRQITGTPLRYVERRPSPAIAPAIASATRRQTVFPSGAPTDSPEAEPSPSLAQLEDILDPVPNSRPSGPTVLFEAPQSGAATRPELPRLTAPTNPTASPAEADRLYATRFQNPSMTVPSGAVIPAVLESALDTTLPGAVRAIVSRDIKSFDGARVLIPRGSRVYGEYGADLQPGQNRAHIRWTRLMRPDGVMIALESPASDPLGRAGVKGKVETYFFERLGNTLLGSVVDIGAGVATSQVLGGSVLLGLPQSSAGNRSSENRGYQRTVRVKQGTRVSVFVARDLDFSTVE